MKDPSAQIVDVRTSKEVAEGKISGSMNMDYFSSSFIAIAEKKLDKKNRI